MATLMGSSSFTRLTGADGPMIRLLEARGIINPVRSDKGWRLFSETDVEAAKRHLAARREERRRQEVERRAEQKARSRKAKSK
jgi:DNA-binding transcriptional MerR regulator